MTFCKRKKFRLGNWRHKWDSQQNGGESRESREESGGAAMSNCMLSWRSNDWGVLEPT